MPYQWTAERERQMLLLAISSANLRPSADTWSAVASLLGEGLTPSAVSQKYYKLRNESSKLLDNSQPSSTPSTPTKRKASSTDGVHKTPRKKVRSPVKAENFDGLPFSDSSNNSPEGFKVEDIHPNTYPMYTTSSFPQPNFFRPTMDHFNGESSSSSSSGRIGIHSDSTSNNHSFISSGI